MDTPRYKSRKQQRKFESRNRTKQQQRKLKEQEKPRKKDWRDAA